MSKLRRGEEVPTDPRRAMTPARKRRIHEARDGRCGECGEPVPMFGNGVVYDHRLTLWISGSDADEDIWPIHKGCDQKKTPQDLKTIAKIKRIRKKRSGEKSPSKRPMKSRQFNKSVRKKFDGTIEPRIEKQRKGRRHETEPDD